MDNNPANSPCAPALGCKEISSKPVISFNIEIELLFSPRSSKFLAVFSFECQKKLDDGFIFLYKLFASKNLELFLDTEVYPNPSNDRFIVPEEAQDPLSS